MFQILSWLLASGYTARIENNHLMVCRNDIFFRHKDIPEHEIYEYFEMYLQDAFPKIGIRMVEKWDSWILFRKI